MILIDNLKTTNYVYFWISSATYQYKELYHTPRISYQLNEIIPAAISGKTDTLFVEKNSDEFGIYNQENGKLILNNKKEIKHASQTKFTAIQTFINGGKSYSLNAE